MSHYITNYAIKNNCSQYQRVMAAAMVRKALKDHVKNPTPTFANYIPTLDKFALKAFNWLSHNCEVSGPLVASYLLDLPDHYSLKAIVILININLLKIKFPLILSSQNFNWLDDIIWVNSDKVRLCLLYKHYAHCGLAFEKVSIYEYFWYVFIVKHS